MLGPTEGDGLGLEFAAEDTKKIPEHLHFFGGESLHSWTGLIGRNKLVDCLFWLVEDSATRE